MQGPLICLSGGKLKIPKGIKTDTAHFDFEFVTTGILVVIKPPEDYLYVRYSDSDSYTSFRLGIRILGLERAAFYRDENGALRLMALTRTKAYDYFIGYQEIMQDTGTSKS